MSKTEKTELQEMQRALAECQQAITDLRAANVELDARLQLVEVSAPPELRALSLDSVRSVVASDPCARFEVLADWRGQFVRGSQIRADHVPHLADFVGAGLLLGAPQDQSRTIERYRAEAAAKAERAAAEAKQLRLAGARAEVDAALARTAAVQATDLPPVDDHVQAAVAAAGA